jgi:hypothetical protein
MFRGNRWVINKNGYNHNEEESSLLKQAKNYVNKHARSETREKYTKKYNNLGKDNWLFYGIQKKSPGWKGEM